MTTPHSRLSVKQLRKSFKQRQVVQDFSLDIESGEVVGLLGPNGAVLASGRPEELVGNEEVRAVYLGENFDY